MTRRLAILACAPLLALSTTWADTPSIPADDLYAPAARALDSRIDSSAITTQPPPPILDTVLQPLAPQHAIATDPAQVPISVDHFEKARSAIQRGLAHLAAQQNESGAWMRDISIGPTDDPERPSPVAVAVTALIVKARLQADPASVESLELRKALQFIYSARQADGSFDTGGLNNYVTSIVASTLAVINDDAAGEVRDGAVTWLREAQWDQSEGVTPEQDWFGGAGYGNRGRPDLSNTQMMLEALYDSGIEPSDPAFQKAVAFLTRTQNRSDTNRAEWVGDDGGFIYTCANGGESMASQYVGEGRKGETMPEGAPRRLRSYGSMTYAGFKSLLYAGLSPQDPRVQSAFDWIRAHWTFDENPGVGQQGLYYFHHALARALRVNRQPVITDADDAPHNWREELIDAVTARQQDDGSWVNRADRWLEGQPELATAYCVLALEEALKPVRRNRAESVEPPSTEEH
jgi:hypothetical protein